MKKLYFIISLLFFSCSENKVSIDIPTLSKYNIISDYSDVADTLNVYLDKTLGLTLEISVPIYLIPLVYPPLLVYMVTPFSY